MSPFLAKAREIALDILFPPLCISCRLPLTPSQKELAFCELCFSKIPVNTALTCPVCKARLALNIKICHKNSSYRLAAAVSYDNEIIKNLIWQLKYEKHTAAAKILAEVLKRHLNEIGLNLADYALMPMPLHKNRERERGFNQAQVIAEILSEKMQIPANTKALRRIKDTLPQAEVRDFDAREKNLEHGFAVPNKEMVAGRNIILIDDVFTSGATMNAAVSALKDAGAKHVIGLVVAKAG